MNKLTNEKKGEKIKQQIQDLLEKNDCAIQMKPQLVPEGILITMDLIVNKKDEDTNTNNKE